MKHKKHEIRITLPEKLYEKISKEAERRYTTMAEVARETLLINLLPQEKHTQIPVSNPSLQTHSNHHVVPTPSPQHDNRLLSSSISKVERLLTHIETNSEMLVLMVNHFYFDLMMHIPNVPEELRPAAIAIAKRRHSQWLEKVDIKT